MEQRRPRRMKTVAAPAVAASTMAPRWPPPPPSSPSLLLSGGERRLRLALDAWVGDRGERGGRGNQRSGASPQEPLPTQWAASPSPPAKSERGTRSPAEGRVPSRGGDADGKANGRS
ncbi:Os11g0554200 [Oryza sativa Japonica Group]|uniref:Os11g0554200 protein n=2 Tax=Oryza sativa subsp. japonica TaxID=39947 RepID=A0A9K3Y719_ORYSJ|nr:expressed protein [Oryza sativa Japonica Group]EEE52274.1 hypothetical protein OsJ_34245 [Oryza sativa Japonica Group]BAF28449.1 Os11g0554200 [Oryza sativa Japonica Group]|eukprot:NP_001068086.1 Os11g0554200 [Oryza sativa Japonica Group]